MGTDTVIAHPAALATGKAHKLPLVPAVFRIYDRLECLDASSARKKRGSLNVNPWQALIILTASLACLFGMYIGTLSGEHFLFGLGIGAPVAIGLFIYLHYRNRSRKGSQNTGPRFWKQAAFLSALGIFAGFLSSGGWALANAAVVKARSKTKSP